MSSASTLTQNKSAEIYRTKLGLLNKITLKRNAKSKQKGRIDKIEESNVSQEYIENSMLSD